MATVKENITNYNRACDLYRTVIQVPRLYYLNNLREIFKEIYLFINKDHRHEHLHPYMFISRTNVIT